MARDVDEKAMYTETEIEDVGLLGLGTVKMVVEPEKAELGELRL